MEKCDHDIDLTDAHSYCVDCYAKDYGPKKNEGEYVCTQCKKKITETHFNRYGILNVFCPDCKIWHRAK